MPPKPNQRRRDSLLDQLEAIVLDEGFEHLRVGALADRLHCSRSTLYKLAESKEELITLVFERFAERALAEATAAADELSDPAEKIMRFSDVVDRFQMKGSVAFWRDVRAHPQVAASLSQSRARGYLTIKRYLDEGVEVGEFRNANTAFAAHLVWVGAAATRDPDLLASLGVDRAEAAHELSQLIVYGMGCGADQK